MLTCFKYIATKIFWYKVNNNYILYLYINHIIYKDLEVGRKQRCLYTKTYLYQNKKEIQQSEHSVLELNTWFRLYL